MCQVRDYGNDLYVITYIMLYANYIALHLRLYRYANRAKNIKNKPKINEDPKDALLREFQEELARLKSQLGGGRGGAGGKKRGRKHKIGPNGQINILEICFTV